MQGAHAYTITRLGPIFTHLQFARLPIEYATNIANRSGYVPDSSVALYICTRSGTVSVAWLRLFDALG